MTLKKNTPDFTETPETIQRITIILSIIFSTFIISACGGGGGGSSTPAPDTTAPSVPALQLNAISLSNVDNYTIDVSSAEAGTTAVYSFSDIFNTTIQGEANVTSSSFSIQNISLATLADGNIDFQIILEDAAGNQSSPTGPTLVKDTLAPDNYSVSTSIPEINEANEANFSFTVTSGSENTGDTLHYSISDEASGLISGTSVIASTSQPLNNINISTLSAGVITLSISLSDDVNNIGNDVSITINKTSAGSNVLLSGNITFDFVPHNNFTNGLDYLSTFPKVARLVEVQLVDSNDNVIDSTLTDTQGDYQFSVAVNTLVRVRVISSTKSPPSPSSPSWEFSVTDNTNSNSLYAMQGALISTGTANSIRDLHAPSGWDGSEYSQPRVAAPFAVLDTIYTALQLIISADADVIFPFSEIRWSENNRPASGAIEDGDIGTSYYSPSEGHIYLLGAADTDTDEYDQHVIVHEWCHYLTDSLSRDESIGGPHSNQDKLDPRVALSEGLCNAISGIALDDPIYRDSDGDDQISGFNFNLENNNFSNKGWYSEATAGSIIYDISDLDNDGADNVSLGFTPIYDALSSTNYLSADAFTTLYLFFDELKNQLSPTSPSTVSDINSLISSHNFIVDNATGINETNDGGDARTLPIYQTITVGGSAEVFCSFDNFGTANKLGNTQFAIFSTPSSSNYSITVTRTSGDLNSDPDFLLWRNRTPIAISESDAVDSEIWNGGLPADTYLLEIYDANNIYTDSGKDVCFSVQIN